MTLAELIDRVCAERAISRTEARKVVATIFTAIAEAAARNQPIAIREFGRFRVTATPARDGRNPRTGETIVIPAGRRLRFSPAKAIKNRLNGASGHN